MSNVSNFHMEVCTTLFTMWTSFCPLISLYQILFLHFKKKKKKKIETIRRFSKESGIWTTPALSLILCLSNSK